LYCHGDVRDDFHSDKNVTDNNLKIPRGVWVLGFVSLLMDVSSEMIHSLLPMFMVTTLGISVLSVGVNRGAGRIDRADREGVLRRVERLPWQTQNPGAAPATAWAHSPSRCSRWRRAWAWCSPRA